MKTRFKGLRESLNREVKRIVKDSDLVMMLLLAPLFYSILYCSFYIFKTESKVPVEIIDLDRSMKSKEFARDLNTHQLIDVKQTLNDFNAAKEDLYYDKVQGVIYIPKDFENDIKSGKAAEIKIYLNTQRFLPSNDLNKAVNEVALDYAARTRIKTFESSGYSPEQALEASEPLREDVRYLFNPSQTYGDFLIPAVLMLILQQTLFMALGESIAKERETGTLKELFSLANYHTSAAIAGKTSFYFILYSAYTLLFATLHFTVLKLNFIGSYPLFFFLAMIFLFAVIGYSLFFGSFFKRKMLALQVIAFTSYPIFFLSGYSWPLSALPQWLQYISQLIPLTPFLRAYTRVTMMGADFADILPEIIQLIILAAAGYLALYFRMAHLNKEVHHTSLSIKAGS